MQRFIVLLILLNLFFIACKENRCNKSIKVAEKEIEQNNIMILIPFKYVIPETIIYDVWKDFNVEVERKSELNLYDSCFYARMRDELVKRNNITNDSILKYVQNLYPKVQNSLVFSDSAFSGVITINYFGGKRPSPEIEGELFYKKIDSLIEKNKNLFPTDEYLNAWITIDTVGNIEKFEIIHKISNEADSIIKSFYIGQKWKPAIFNNSPVRFRYREII